MRLLKAPRKRVRWVIGLALVSAMGLGYAAQAATAQPVNATARFTAVQLVDGLMFQQGPAAQLLADLERPEIEWNDETVKGREVTLAAVAKDARWGQSFAARIQSGDPTQITTAIGELAKVHRAAMNDWLGKENVDRWLGEIDQGYIGLIRYWHRYLFFYRYIFFVRYFYYWWSRPWYLADAHQSLPDELTVRVIAVNLRAAAPA